MADIYVRSTTGSDANSGLTNWGNAKATLAGAAAIDAAGDRIFVSSVHSSTLTSSTTYNIAGTASDPVQILSVNDSASPATALENGAYISTEGAFGITFNGSFYAEGLSIESGKTSGGAGGVINLAQTSQSTQTFRLCNLFISTTSSGGRLQVGQGGAENITLRLIDCTLKFASSGQGITLQQGRMEIDGGSIASGSTALTSGFINTIGASRGQHFVIRGMDLTNIGSASPLVKAGLGTPLYGRFQNCRLPAGWSGSLTTGSLVSGERYSLYNCDSSSANYRLWIEDYAGSIRDETSIVRTGGATDGTTPIAWRMASSANTKNIGSVLETDDIAVWNDSTGSSKTLSVEITHSSPSLLTDSEVWIEVRYLGSSAAPVSVPVTNRRSDILATPSNQPTSSVAWTGSAQTYKQKLSVTFTPQMKGFIYARVVLARPSTTIFVCPKPELT